MDAHGHSEHNRDSDHVCDTDAASQCLPLLDRYRKQTAYAVTDSLLQRLMDGAADRNPEPRHAHPHANGHPHVFPDIDGDSDATDADPQALGDLFRDTDVHVVTQCLPVGFKSSNPHLHAVPQPEPQRHTLTLQPER